MSFPTAGYIVWGSSFLWNRGGLYLGHSWLPSPCIPPQQAFSVENKLFLGNNLLTASFLPAGTSEPWRSVAQKGCKAGSMERSPPGWIHTIVTWYLISGWNCACAILELPLYGYPWQTYTSKHVLKEFHTNTFTLGPWQCAGEKLCGVPTPLTQMAPDAVERWRRSCSLPCFSC